MKAKSLLDNLIKEYDVDETQIRALHESLPARATLDEFRQAVVDADLLSLSDIMRVHFKTNLLPASKRILVKLKKKREQQVYIKPKVHKHKFIIQSDDRFNEQIAFAAGELPVTIPNLDHSELNYHYSDEKQAVSLSVELINMGELQEAETILLETLDSFKDSTAAIKVLCWLYVCSGHPDEVAHWADEYTKQKGAGVVTLEIAALANQLQNKHITATAQYHKLIHQNQVKPIWYLLLAYSQERSMCLTEAIENYRIYSSISRDEQLAQFAKSNMTKLKTV